MLDPLVDIPIQFGDAGEAPLDQLRTALERVRALLAKEGASAADLNTMKWSTCEPDIFSPTIREVDIAYRDILSAFKPQIDVIPTPKSDLRGSLIGVSATATRPPEPPKGTVYRGYTYPQLLRQYSPRMQIPDVMAYKTKRSRSEIRFRNEHRFRDDIQYGNSPWETLDLFIPLRSSAPRRLHIFIHGGYWMSMDKVGNAQNTRAYLDAGYAVAVLNYGLCPDISLAKQIDQLRSALVFLWNEAHNLGFAQRPFDLCGQSSGAHNAAMLLTTDWKSLDHRVPANVISSATLISGLYDLTPVMKMPQGPLLGIADEDEMLALSPVNLTPHPDVSILYAVGSDESDEFKAQTDSLRAAWENKAKSTFLSIPGRNHYTIIEDFEEGLLSTAALRNSADSDV